MDYELIENGSEFVFFLHGFGASKDAFLFAKDYVQKPCSMVFVSFAGFGKSPPPDKPYFVKDYANDVKALIDSLNIHTPITIVCHSFGARVAAVLAGSNKGLVNKILIVDGAGLKPRRSIKYYIRVHKYKRLKKQVLAGKKPSNVLENYGSADYRSQSKVMRQTFINVVNQDLANYFKAIDAKVYIMWGQKDTETPLYMAKKLKRLISNSELYVVKNASHFSYLDDTRTFILLLNKLLEM